MNTKKESKNKKQLYSQLFIILTCISITCLLISNIIAIKTIRIFGLIFTAADILFPITYILNDVFTEVYGFEKARLVIWLSFACNLLMVTLFQITIALPPDATFTNQEALISILSSTPRILIASFIAYLVGNFSNSISLSIIKVKTKGKYLALRTIGSTIIGELLDTIIFVPLAYYGTLDLKDIGLLIINIYVFKVLLEAVLTPLTYKVIAFLKKKESIDTYDNDIKYKLI